MSSESNKLKHAMVWFMLLGFLKTAGITVIDEEELIWIISTCWLKLQTEQFCSIWRWSLKWSDDRDSLRDFKFQISYAHAEKRNPSCLRGCNCSAAQTKIKTVRPTPCRRKNWNTWRVAVVAKVWNYWQQVLLCSYLAAEKSSFFFSLSEVGAKDIYPVMLEKFPPK